MFQEGLRTKLNAYNSSLIWNISWTDYDSSPILQYNKRTAPLPLLFFSRRGSQLPPLSSGQTAVGTLFLTKYPPPRGQRPPRWAIKWNNYFLSRIVISGEVTTALEPLAYGGRFYVCRRNLSSGYYPIHPPNHQAIEEAALICFYQQPTLLPPSHPPTHQQTSPPPALPPSSPLPSGHSRTAAHTPALVTVRAGCRSDAG